MKIRDITFLKFCFQLLIINVFFGCHTVYGYFDRLHNWVLDFEIHYVVENDSADITPFILYPTGEVVVFPLVSIPAPGTNNTHSISWSLDDPYLGIYGIGASVHASGGGTLTTTVSIDTDLTTIARTDTTPTTVTYMLMPPSGMSDLYAVQVPAGSTDSILNFAWTFTGI